MSNVNVRFVTVDPVTFLPPEKTVTALNGAILTPHVNDSTPHPTYDDIPDLKLIFENGIV